VALAIAYLAATVAGIIPLLGGTLSTSPSWVLGIAPVNLNLNVLHAAIALLGLLASASSGGSRAYARVMGLFLLALGVLGLIQPAPLPQLPLSGVDFLLHLLSGGVALYYGFAPADDVY
jgi:hypothetical protein